jgi:hypothetical protein
MTFVLSGCFLDSMGYFSGEGGSGGTGGRGDDSVTGSGAMGGMPSVGGMGGGSTSKGGGGSVSDGGGGNPSVGGGGEGGGPNPVRCTVTWTVPSHSAGKYLGIGGIIEPAAYVMPFPGTGCMAASVGDNTVVCSFEQPAAGAELQFNLYNYDDIGGMVPFAPRCDQPGFPSSDCPGSVVVECSSRQVIPTFQDDNIEATPPPAPWSYVVVNDVYEIATTMP